jgi:hypothetical protein
LLRASLHFFGDFLEAWLGADAADLGVLLLLDLEAK